MSIFRYIAVEGPIGVGKTTLSRRLAGDLGATLILEEEDQNPFLPQFYKNIDQEENNFAFQTQVFFLLSRFRQQKELAQQDLFQNRQLSDYLFAKDRIFATLTLNSDELALYNNLYNSLQPLVIKPDLVIFLQASPETLIKRVEQRGIPYERPISLDYLETLSQAYTQFFFQYDQTKVLTVNCNEIDIINKNEDYSRLMKEIQSLEGSPKQKSYLSISSN